MLRLLTYGVPYLLTVTYLLTYLPTYLLTYLPTYLLTYLPFYSLAESVSTGFKLFVVLE